MGGASDEKSGDLFAFIAKDGPGEERILTLPGEKPITKKSWKFIARNMLQVSSAKKGEMVYVAGDKKWCKWSSAKKNGRPMTPWVA